MRNALLWLATVTGGSIAAAFVAPKPSFSSVRRSNQQSRLLPYIDTDTSTALKTVQGGDELFTIAADGARREFFLWFFFGSGGAGIAVAQLPILFENFQNTRSLGGVGPTLGGEMIGVSPVCGYSTDLSRADVESVLDRAANIESLVRTGPKPNYMSQCGYLCYDSLVAGCKGCNPLAVRAVMDALSTSGADNVSPEVAQRLMDDFRAEDNGLEAFKAALLKSKLTGYASIGFLLFLLGLSADITLACFRRGWFPDWPGNENFSLYSLLVDPGAWTIPEYWI